MDEKLKLKLDNMNIREVDALLYRGEIPDTYEIRVYIRKRKRIENQPKTKVLSQNGTPRKTTD